MVAVLLNASTGPQRVGDAKPKSVDRGWMDDGGGRQWRSCCRAAWSVEREKHRLQTRGRVRGGKTEATERAGC